MSDHDDGLFDVEVSRQDLRRARTGELYQVIIPLWFDVGHSPERQQLVGTSHAELAQLLRRYGNYVRAQAIARNFTQIAEFWRIIYNMHEHRPWAYLGVTPQEARQLIQAYARHLYTAMDTAPENAARIVIIYGYSAAEWEVILGPGSIERLARQATRWAGQAYKELHQTDLDPETAVETCRLLATFAGQCFYAEDVQPDTSKGWPAMYALLDFTHLDVLKMCRHWARQCNKT